MRSQMPAAPPQKKGHVTQGSQKEEMMQMYMSVCRNNKKLIGQ